MAQANIKAVITAEDRASATLKKFGGAVDGMNDKVVNGAKKAAKVFAVAAAAATVFAVKSAADFEQTRIGLENMLGSADKARALLAKISKFAAETPFEFPELAQATRQLVAFGFSADEAYNTMKDLGDVSAAVGAPINDLAYLMGTLRAQGRAFTIDIRQFAMRGIPIYEYLAKVLKTNTQEITKMIEEGKIGFPEVQKAFELMTSKGEAFHGTMAKQSKSLSGLFSTFKDLIGQTARELVGITQTGDVKPGSLFDKLRIGTAWLIDNLPKLISQFKQIINSIIPQLQQWASNIRAVAQQVAEYLAPKLEALWNTLNERLIPAMVQFYKEIILPLIPVLGTVLVGALGFVIDALNVLLTAFSGVINFLRKNESVFWGIVGVLGAIKVALFLQGALAAFKGVMAGAASSYKSLKALVSTQMVMPAIAVGAAIAALHKVYEEGRKLQALLDDVTAATQDFGNSRAAFVSSLGKAKKEGRIDQKEYNRRLNKYNEGLPASLRASGGSVNTGQPYMVGERGPELFVPNQAGTIRKNSQSGGGTINVNVNIGMYAGSEMEKRKIATALAQAYKDATGTNMAWSN